MAHHEWIKLVRLTLACFLAPAMEVIWFHAFLTIVDPYFVVHYPGPSPIGAGFQYGPIELCVPCCCTLFLLIPYVLVMLARDRLNFRTVMLPTVVMAMVYGLLVYASLHSDNSEKYPWIAQTMGMLSTLGVILSGLCFYFVGVWGTAKKGAAVPTAPIT
jgi:hypothetical protein